MKSSPNIAVLGAGSWGTALAILLAEKDFSVKLWGHSSVHISTLQKDGENRRHLPGARFPHCLQPVDKLSDAVSCADIILLVIPSHVLRRVFAEAVPFLTNGVRIVSASKGVENDTLATMHQVVVEELNPHNLEYSLAVLSGPSFAREVVDKQPTAVTIGAENYDRAEELQEVFSTDFFRVYTSLDIIGLEISGAFKNIMAIAAGICDGLGYGSNTRAALITRGLSEMQRLGLAFDAELSTFSGLSGLGDLLLTCTGDLSRNRSVGLQLGRGYSIEHIEQTMFMVAEGVKTTLSLYKLARSANISTPILDEVYAIIYLQKDPKQAVRDLLRRSLGKE